MKGLYVGRFDPFHLGHLKLCQFFDGLVDDLKIGLGQERKGDYFTLEERKDMIISNTNIDPIYLEDLSKEHPFYWDWGGYVLDLIEGIDIVATGNEYVKNDFSKHGIPVLWFPRYDGISGTKIRNLISLADDSWEDLVPEKTKKITERKIKYGF